MKKILLSLAGLLGLWSCGNDWIDKAEPHNGTVTPNVIFENEQSITNAVVGNLYYYRQYVYDRHVTYGLYSYFLAFDWMGNDLTTNPGQWWTYESWWNQTISGANGYLANFHWAMFYKIINDANTKIRGIEASTVVESAKTRFIAELRALRGYAYSCLIRSFQFSYAHVSPSAPGVPIYIEPTSPETKGNDRASISEVYAQILSDLNYAVEHLPATRDAKFRVNKNLAQAWRANAHLEMREWAKAEADAKAARQGFALMDAATYQSTGFNSIDTPEWVWGFPFQPDQALLYASRFSHCDIFRPQAGYKNFFVNDNLVALFSETDMRNVFVTPSPQFGSQKLWARNGARKYQDTPDADGDYVMMRASEMWLVEAEAMAQQGKNTEAAALLFALQKHRDPALTAASGNTGQDLIEEILVERRKELYGEIGTEFFDLKRYNRPLLRTGNHAATHLFDVPAGDHRWILAIPRSEFDRNPNIKEQNPGR